MVARAPTSPTGANPVLDADLRAEVADLRARGKKWEEVARAVQWDAVELCRAARRDPDFPAALEAAEEEVWREGQANGFARLCALTNDADPDRAKEASEIIMRYSAEKMKYAAQKRRDETRLAIERLRAETRITCAKLRAKPAHREEIDDDDAVPDLTQAQVELVEQYRQEYERACAKACAGKAHVYLWGGCHKIGGVEPDDTDTHLHMTVDDSLPGRAICWAVHPDLLGFDHRNGPFLTPPGCRPRSIRDPRTGYIRPDPYARGC